MELTFVENEGFHTKIAVDQYRKIVHVMNLEENKMSDGSTIPKLQEQVREQLGIGSVSEWSWFIYESNGMVSDYKKGSHYFVQSMDERVYPGFTGEMLVRMHKESSGLLTLH